MDKTFTPEQRFFVGVEKPVCFPKAINISTEEWLDFVRTIINPPAI